MHEKTIDSRELEMLYMDILLENTYLLNELRVVGSQHVECDYDFVAYRDKLWIFPTDWRLLGGDVIGDLSNTFGIPPVDADNFEDIVKSISKFQTSGYKILVGKMEFDSEIMYLDNRDLFKMKDKNNSAIIRQVSRELSPSKIAYMSFDTNTDGKIFFHGTASAYLKSILRQGLTSNTANSNFPFLKDMLNGRTFLTSNYRYANNYAINSAMATKSISVVISFRVPHYELLEPDYDIQTPINRFSSSKDKEKEALKLSKEIGIFAYRGRILPNHIVSIYIPGKGYDDPPIEIPYSVARQFLNNMDVDTKEYINSFYR